MLCFFLCGGEPSLRRSLNIWNSEAGFLGVEFFTVGPLHNSCGVQLLQFSIWNSSLPAAAFCQRPSMVVTFGVPSSSVHNIYRIFLNSAKTEMMCEGSLNSTIEIIFYHIDLAGSKDLVDFAYRRGERKKVSLYPTMNDGRYLFSIPEHARTGLKQWSHLHWRWCRIKPKPAKIWLSWNLKSDASTVQVSSNWFAGVHSDSM